MPELTLIQLGLGLLAALGIGIAKAGFGGVMMVVIVIMAELFGALPSVGIVLPLLIVADLTAYGMFRAYSSWRAAFKLLVPALPGVALGYLLLRQLDESSARILIGWLIVALLGVKIILWKWESVLFGLHNSAAFTWLCGICAGISTTVANAAGPVMTAYLLVRKQEKMEFLGMAARFFLLINLIKVPLNVQLGLINAKSLMIDLALVPAIFLGVWLGRMWIKRIPQRAFEILLLIFAVIAALKLLLWP